VRQWSDLVTHFLGSTPLVAAELEISLTPDPNPEDQALCCTLLEGVASEIYGPAMASSPMSSIERREAGTHTRKECECPLCS
jgi:hypothetical protein